MDDKQLEALVQELIAKGESPEVIESVIAQWDSQQAPSTPDVTTADPKDFTPRSFGGFVSNAFEDAKGIYDAVTSPSRWPGIVLEGNAAKRQAEADMVAGMENRAPAAFSMPGDRLAAELQMIPGMVANAVYDDPVSSALSVAPGVPAAVRGGKRATSAVVRTAQTHPTAAAAVTGAAVGGIKGGVPGAVAGAVTGATGGPILDRLRRVFGKVEDPPATPEAEMGLSSADAVAARSATDVRGPSRSALDIERPRASDPVAVESPSMPLSSDADLLRRALGIEGPERSAIDIGRARAGGPMLSASSAINESDLLSPMASHARATNAVGADGPSVLDLGRTRGGDPIPTPPKPPSPNAGGRLAPGTAQLTPEGAVQQALDDLRVNAPDAVTLQPSHPPGSFMMTGPANENAISQLHKVEKRAARKAKDRNTIKRAQPDLDEQAAAFRGRGYAPEASGNFENVGRMSPPGDFVNLPQAPLSELARIKATIDAILRRRGETF